MRVCDLVGLSLCHAMEWYFSGCWLADPGSMYCQVDASVGLLKQGVYPVGINAYVMPEHLNLPKKNCLKNKDYYFF